MNKYWFQSKIHGYGAYPSSWEGWLVIVAFIALVIWRASDMMNHLDTTRYFIELGSLVGILIVISIMKTDGKWKWNWGKN